MRAKIRHGKRDRDPSSRGCSSEIVNFFPFPAYYYWTLPTMPTAPTLIQTENLTREYLLGDTVIRAVSELTLAIRTGEFLALLGSSGSGKSTLLSLLAGLDRPTSGTIHVRGRNLAELNTSSSILGR